MASSLGAMGHVIGFTGSEALPRCHDDTEDMTERQRQRQRKGGARGVWWCVCVCVVVFVCVCVCVCVFVVCVCLFVYFSPKAGVLHFVFLFFSPPLSSLLYLVSF